MVTVPALFPSSSRQNDSDQMAIIASQLPWPWVRGVHITKVWPFFGDHFLCDSVIQDFSWMCSVGQLLHAFLGEVKAEAILCIEPDQACV